VVADALADWDAGTSLSIPSKRCRVIVAVSRHVPVRLLQRFEAVGRRQRPPISCRQG
jgi:uncharacterized protein